MTDPADQKEKKINIQIWFMLKQGCGWGVLAHSLWWSLVKDYQCFSLDEVNSSELSVLDNLEADDEQSFIEKWDRDNSILHQLKVAHDSRLKNCLSLSDNVRDWETKREVAMEMY